MPITSFLDIQLKPDAIDEARRVLAEGLKATRAFDGCLGVEVLVDKANPAHWTLVEKWQSLEHDTAYRKFRASPEGAMAEFGKTLAGAPSLVQYEALDI